MAKTLFIDEVTITIESGKGGNGASSFRREKFIPYGGPDGGRGGDGGSVLIRASSRLNTFSHFRGSRFFKAADGQKGAGQLMFGEHGEDLVLLVPVGTKVKDAETQEVLCDLKHHNDTYLAAVGGIGGRGNDAFKSSVNQAPTEFEEGTSGVTRKLFLELSLLADVAFLGIPSAGKSTLLSVLTRATPKIGDYPFTTLSPQLGVMHAYGKDIILADIPGLIENASQGVGLGTRFLKHLSRTKGLIHLLDVSIVDMNDFESTIFDVISNYHMIRNELTIFDPNISLLPEIVVLTKVDVFESNEIDQITGAICDQLAKKVVPISAFVPDTLIPLKELIFQLAKLEDFTDERPSL